MGGSENFDSRMVSFALSLGGLLFFELSKLLFDFKPYNYRLLEVGSYLL